MKVYYFSSDKNNVTVHYLDIIIETISRMNIKVEELLSPSWQHTKRLSRSDSWFITTGHKDVAKLTLLGFRHFINWFQGLPAEEDYLQTGSLIRKWAMNILDYITFVRPLFGFFVSTHQISYFTKKFHHTPRHTFVMPCFNEDISVKHFFTQGKYENNEFCYVGSTDAWQCFDEIIELYKNLETSHENCSLKIITQHPEQARIIVNKAALKRYVIKSVSREQVAQEIATSKFGFIIRHDISVNHVATPTKMSNYLANGVMPVFSNSLYSYCDLAKKHKYMYVVTPDNAINVIETAMNTVIKPEEVLESYKSVFDTYFNKEKYICRIIEELKCYLG